MRALVARHEERFAARGKEPKVGYDGLEYWYDGYIARPARPLAVGISWDPKAKEHACAIEEC